MRRCTRVALSGTDWAPNSLTKRTSAGHGAGSVGELADIAAMPAEPQVAVGAVELGEVGQHPAVGDRRSRRVGLLERPLDPAVEHRLVPRRELLSGDPAQSRTHRITVELGSVGDRLVVGAPLDDRRVMAERRHRFGAPGGPLLGGRGGRSPTAAGKSWSSTTPSSSAAVYRSSVAMCACTRKASRPASTARSTSPRTRSGATSARPGTGRNEVGALEEHPLAVDREHPIGERHLAQAGPARRLVADLAVDDDFDTDVGERLRAERMRPPQRAARRCRATTRCRCCRPRGCARFRRRPHRRRRCACGRCRSSGRPGGRAGAGGHGSRRRRGTARAGVRCARRRSHGCARCATGRRGSSRGRRPRSAAACR